MIERAFEVVLVEDNPYDVDLALHAFREMRLTNHVKVLRDGAEALTYLLPPDGTQPGAEGCPPKLILLDLKLPFVDGIEVLRQLKNDERTRRLPVVALTSSREDRDIVECYDLGVNSYIVKPVDFEQFAEAVRTLGVYWLLMNQSSP